MAGRLFRFIFYQAYLLGVKPLEPGFKTFKVDPSTSVLDKVNGKVPTPYGDIVVEWEKINGGIKYNVSYPYEIKCIKSGDIPEV